MALIKNHVAQVVEELPSFTNIEDAIAYYNQESDTQKKDYAIEEISKFENGGKFLISLINHKDINKNICTKVASVISKMDPEKAPIEDIMDLLRLENAYVRNLGISMLRSFGTAIKYYIVKFLIGEDRDLRIFAINVLGDVDFAESRDMMVELLENEKDINVAMTAVDYMGEIGEEKDIPLLESLKDRFLGDAYVQFAVDGAVKLIKG